MTTPIRSAAPAEQETIEPDTTPLPTPLQGSWLIDRMLVARIAASGVEKAVAEDMARRTLTAIAEQIREGRYVTIPDVGKLTTRLKRKAVPGTGRRKAQEIRVAAVADAATHDGKVTALDPAAVTHRGAAYDVC